MNISTSFGHLKIAIILVIGVLAVGTVGYMFVEHLSFIDALYTTIIMMATVGIVIHPLTEHGRIFTIFIIVFGVGSLLYTLGVGMEFMVEGHFSQRLRIYMMNKHIEALCEHVIICGFGRVGSRIAEDCAAACKHFVVIDEDERNVEKCLERDYYVVQGDATSDEILRGAGILRAQSVLVATDNDANNIFITLSARHLNDNLFIVARANDTETEAKLKRAGADRVLSPYIIGGHRMASLALQSDMSQARALLTESDYVELVVEEILVEKGSSLVGKMTSDVQKIFPHGLAIVTFKGQSNRIAGPEQDTLIEEGDVVVVVGLPAQLAIFKARMSLSSDPS